MGQSITNVFRDGKSFALLTFVSATGLIDKMDVRENRLKRFRQILTEQCGGVIAELARRIDKSAPQVRVMLNPEKTGGRWIGEKIARDIELRLGLPRGWLDQEGGEEDVEEFPDHKYVFIPRLNVEAAAGCGKENNHHVEVMETLAFRRDWIARKGLNPSDLEVYEAAGESMSPYIENGDVLLVHVTDDAPRNNEPWVIWQDGFGVRVKRLLFREDGSIIIRSDNPDKSMYPDEIIARALVPELRTIGRVVWRGG